jgi:hypothetical protein
MALPASGAISLSQVQTEFGGANPIDMSEYYRGGANVPASKSVTVLVREPGPGTTNWDATSLVRVPNSGLSTWMWRGTTVAVINSGISSVVVNGWTYVRGGIFRPAANHDDWQLRRQQNQTTVTNMNVNIPASGGISFNQLYGGTKT